MIVKRQASIELPPILPYCNLYWHFEGICHSEQQSSSETLHRPRHPVRRNPEMSGFLRSQDKENMVPEKSGSRRRRRRRVSTSRSPLPADYPRAPLQDITLYMHILQRSRTRAGARMQIHGISPPRQPMIHVSPSQETDPTLTLDDPLQEAEPTTANPILVLESPLQQSEPTITSPRQLPEDSTLPNFVQLPEQESHGLTTDTQTEEQNCALDRTLSHHGNIITDSSLTAEVGMVFHHDYITEEARARDVSMLANQEHGAFGSVLQSKTWNEQSGRGRGGSHPQPKKKSSLKQLMKMR
ncbi:hypothetical protein SUGI_0371980 [Cryptomeria japonica]|nr:hypothetical protein SUGI_0371980 [Cryptomeria japonica]